MTSYSSSNVTEARSEVSHVQVPAGDRTLVRRMRRAMTDAELKRWNAVPANRLMGPGFRRQLPIAGFIADFACAEHKLIVEVDGLQHGDDAAAVRDAERTAILEDLGWTVLRVWNHDVLTNIEGVCDATGRAIGPEKLR